MRAYQTYTNKTTCCSWVLAKRKRARQKQKADLREERTKASKKRMKSEGKDGNQKEQHGKLGAQKLGRGWKRRRNGWEVCKEHQLKHEGCRADLPLISLMCQDFESGDFRGASEILPNRSMIRHAVSSLLNSFHTTRKKPKSYRTFPALTRLV